MSNTRIQLALNVDNIDDGIAFYSKLFGVAPHKQREGYANFVVEDPPLKLVLFESPAAPERLNHLGIETTSVDDIAAADARFRAAGLETRVAMSDLCCHAVQDKIFVSAPNVPNGYWEYYAITDDNLADEQGIEAEATASMCCTNERSSGSVCCS